jgi:drug/metabolite transporter (DMT)-like permease
MPPPYGASSAGYPSPSYPGGYYPAPDYMGGYGPSQPGMNTMAIVSLVSSIVGVFCCIGSIVSIVLGTTALNQIKRTREEGYGLAVAGIVIGVATLVVYLIVGIFIIPSR